MGGTWLDLNTINLLGRVDSRIDEAAFIREICRSYGLGRVKRFTQIREGFEDYNIRLSTSQGVFLVKLFSQYKSFRHVKDNIRGLVEFERAGVDVPKLRRSLAGDWLFYYETGEAGALACVMEFFAGKSFYKLGVEPSQAEIKKIVVNMTRINSVRFKPLGTYDVWGAVNLTSEFVKKERFLSRADRLLMKPYVAWLKKLELGRCRQGTIHGDLQRSNILRDRAGEMRIIDFSVMQRGALVVELAVFLALFCLNPGLRYCNGEIAEIYNLVVGEYQKSIRLGREDLKILPRLIGATYAINCLAASYELRGKQNHSEETEYWLELGSRGVKMIERAIGERGREMNSI